MPSPRTAEAGDGGRSRVDLRAHEGSAEALPVLTAASAPVLTSVFDDGVDFVCAGCATALVSRAHERQVVGVLIRCPVCGLLVGRDRLPGEAMIGAPVLYPSGTTTVPEPGWIGADQVTGEVAFMTYAREVGRQIPPRGLSAPLDRDGDTIRGWADRVRSALGPAYDALVRSDAIGQASRTPPPNRHLAIALLEGAEVAARTLDDAIANPDVFFTQRADVVSDLQQFAEQLERWDRHPLRDQIHADLRPADGTRHTIAMLTAAGYLADQNVGVELVESGTGAHRGDLWLYPNLGLRVGVEVKGPEMFWGRRTRLDPAETVKVIEKKIKKARSQLDHRYPSMLVVVGFHMYGNWHVLQQATVDAMSNTRHRANFLGTMLMNCRPWIGPGVFASSADFVIVQNNHATIDVRQHFPPKPLVPAPTHRLPPTSYTAPA